MRNFEIVRLKPEDFEKCNNIWDLRENEKFTQNIYKELTSGDRVIFVYKDVNYHAPKGTWLASTL